ncbi:LysM domain-containing protein, partial [Staphylococcus sp.]
TTPNETGEDSSNGNATDGENTTSDETGEDQSNEETSNQGTDSSVEGTTHKVAPGETIEGIAKENNTTVNQIVKDNGITDPDLVVAGTDLVINQPSSAHGVNNQATSDNSKASSNELPETGNSSGVNAGLTGGLALVAGAALVASRRRKEQE